eukprot:748147-Prorocentrum_minimum.AAC.1
MFVRISGSRTGHHVRLLRGLYQEGERTRAADQHDDDHPEEVASHQVARPERAPPDDVPVGGGEALRQEPLPQ